jgi:exodeoxyribonuclease VII large subunit
VLTDPYGPLDRHAAQVAALTGRGRAALMADLADGTRTIEHRKAQLAVLGPAATLARGYAVVQSGDASGAVLRDPRDAPAGTRLRIRLADGAFRAVSQGVDVAADDAPGNDAVSGEQARSAASRTPRSRRPKGDA